MCYRKPGPRCSHHTAERLVNIREAKETFRQKIADLENSPEKDVPKVAEKIERMKGLLKSLDYTQEEAQADYDTSPAGLEDTALRYKKAVDVGNEEEAEQIKEKWMQDKAARDAQLDAIKADDALRAELSREGELRNEKIAREWQEQIDKNKEFFIERTAAVNAWNNTMPPGYEPIQNIRINGPNIEAVLHGDIRSEVAEEAFRKAGNNTEGIVFLNASAPHANSMPKISPSKLNEKLQSGELKMSERREFFASTSPTLGGEGKGIRVNFAEGIHYPTVVKKEEADRNSEPEMLLLPGGKSRTLTYSESLTIASAIGNPENVHLRSRRGGHIGSFDRRKVHGAVTREQKTVAQPGRATDRIKESVNEFVDANFG